MYSVARVLVHVHTGLQLKVEDTVRILFQSILAVAVREGCLEEVAFQLGPRFPIEHQPTII